MTRQEVLDILRAHIPEIKNASARKDLAYSALWQEMRPPMVAMWTFEEGHSLRDMAKLKVFLEEILKVDVDIATKSSSTHP